MTAAILDGAATARAIKDELKAAPTFEQYNARPATTSQAPANRPAGAPGTTPKQ